MIDLEGCYTEENFGYRAPDPYPEEKLGWKNRTERKNEQTSTKKVDLDLKVVH